MAKSFFFITLIGLAAQVALAEPAVEVTQLPEIRDNEPSFMFSSWDRTGRNDDGFNGTHSKLRLEDGNSVLAEMQGAGCITRFWMPHTKHFKTSAHQEIENGLFVGKKVHLKIYLDGADEPQIDVEVNDLFNGHVKGFAKPLVGHGHGGFYCYVPIFYKNGCKVVMDGDHMTFYQLNYTKLSEGQLPEASGIDTERSRLLADGMQFRGHKINTQGSESLRWMYQPEAGETITQRFPDGPHRIDGLSFKTDNREALLKAQLKLFWDDADKPAVDVPLAHFLGQTPMTEDYESVITGVKAGRFYNHLPMPYRTSARMGITFPEGLEVQVQAVMTPVTGDQALGYLHAHYAEYLPVKRGQFIEVLHAEGKGHYVGTFLDTRNDKLYNDLIRWLEGDDILTIDGEMAMHGTGTEDYFNCGWYQVPGRLNEAGTYPLHGFSVFSLETPVKAAAAYRWHLEAPIRFENSFEFKLEHGDHNTHPADYRVTAFYYLEEQGK